MSPNLPEITTTTVRSRGAKTMPKKFASKAQANTMRGIAHGWKPPKGSGLGAIPKAVAKKATAENTGKGTRSCCLRSGSDQRSFFA